MNRTLLLGAAVAGLLGAATTAKADPIPKEKLKKMAVSLLRGEYLQGDSAVSGESHGCAAQNECAVRRTRVAVPKEACVAIGGSLAPVAANK